MRYSNRFRAGRRAMAVAATGALVLALTPALASADMHEDVCDDAPEAEFSDVSNGTFGEYIRCIAGYGIVDGFPDGTYRSSEGVTRGQAAKFVVGLIETATDEAMSSDGAEDFSDVQDGGTFSAFIDKASANGLIDGFPDGTYRPSDNLRRGQMAKIVANALESVGAVLDDSPNDSVDDIEGNIFEDEINKLLNAGIVGGFPDGTYRPAADVTRGQLAQFVALGAGELDAQGLWVGPQPSTNQTFSVTPADEATLTVVANPDSNNSDDRQYSVSNPVAGATHTIALFPAANVTVSSGIVTFRDADSNNVADGIGAVEAWITVVNGAAVAADTQVTTVMPSGGTITFTIDGDIAESVVPVVFADADSDGQLDLTVASPANANPKTPSESFGIGGVTTFQPAEAAVFSNPAAGTVVQVDKDANWYTLDNAGGDGVADVLINYVAGDTFTYSSGALSGAPISMAQFETYLSVGDTVNPGVYNPGATSHDIETDIPNAPTGVAANYRSTTNDVRVTWTKVANPDVQDYQVERATVTSGTVGTYSAVGTVAAAATAQFDDTSVTGGTTYSYRVKARNTTPTAGPASDAVQVTIPTAADTTAPTVSSMTVSDNAVTGILDQNDQVAITFSEAVTLTATASVTFRDNDGTVGTVTRGGNATMSQNAARTVAFITLTGSPVLEEPGTTLGLDPTNLTVVNSSGIADDAGNALAEVQVTAATPSTAASTVDFTANSPLDASTVTTADFTTTSTTVTISSVSVSGNVITVTMSGNFAAGDTVTLTANSIANTEGGNGPASNVTTPAAA